MVTEAIAASGYETIAFTGGGYLNPAFGFDPGFDSYHAWPTAAGSSNELATNTDHFIRWLNRNQQTRFFAFFHTYEVHGPFLPRQPYFDR